MIFVAIDIITFIILILSIILMVTCKWSWFLTELTTIKLPKIPTTEQKYDNDNGNDDDDGNGTDHNH